METEVAREHADNRRRAPVYRDPAAQPRRITPEDVLEESVRHDERRRSLGGGCRTTVLEARARQRPEVVRHARGARSEGRARRGDGLVADGVRDHLIERSRVRLPVGEIRSDDHRHRKGDCSSRVATQTRRSASGAANGRSRTAFTRLKTTAVRPRPSARVTIAAAVVSGVRRNSRAP